jgi:hypothetical protein
MKYGSRSYSHISALGKLLLKIDLLSVCWDSDRYLYVCVRVHMCNHIICLFKLLTGWLFFP